MLSPRLSTGLSRWLPTIAFCTLSASCALIDTPPAADQARATLPVPEAKVRAAVLKVLQEEGYEVSQGAEDRPALTTGYRQETDSPADWMLRKRFGTGRSRVEVTLTPDGDRATNLAIAVTYEGKDGLFESWTPYPTPLPQSAENQLRLVKHALGLL